jgi:manganese-dependent inorganic pyrophosphatase
MEKQIKVFGHQSPDTDATCSAIVWAWFLNEHRKQDAKPYVLGTPNSEAAFVLEKWGHDTPEILTEVSSEDTVSVVDTNSKDELFENINETHILSIIDHHKLTGGIETASPREIVIQPYASTMTVMYNIMNIEPADFPKEIAGLMLSGLLSDTLEFRSPTTTDADKELTRALADSLEINTTEYANEMFAAKSDISQFSDKELVLLDSKITEIKGKKMRVSVVETTTPQTVSERKEAILEQMKVVQEEDNLDFILFFIVDILEEQSTLFTNDELAKLLVADAFSIEEKNRDGDITLQDVVSRKKQIIPALSK